MTPHLRHVKSPSDATQAPTRGPQTVASSFTDPFGERHVSFDPQSETSVEVLRFSKEFDESPAFEAALRARVARVGNLHPAPFALVQTVERTDTGRLSLISKYRTGHRLSDLMPRADGWTVALDLIRKITPALATLHQTGGGIGHGALSADRIVVTREGRPVVIEQVFASALASLNLSRLHLRQLGVVVPDGVGPVTFDARMDLLQLGFLALALLLGRKLDPRDYPSKVPALLDEFVRTAESSTPAMMVRRWLERAMQVGADPFTTAREAQAAFDELSRDVDVQVAESAGALLAFPSEARPEAPQPAGKSKTAVAKTPPARTAARGTRPTRRVAPWIIAALVIVAAAEGVAIVALLATRPSVSIVEVRVPRGEPALPSGPSLSADQALAQLATPVRDTAPSPTARPASPAPAANAAPAGPRFGGLTVASAIDLQVFEDGTLVGSTAGPIAIGEGRHALEFVNQTLLFRVAQTVTVTGGRMSSLRIPVPNGRVSINAVPWAEVTIDGVAAGQTPIANHSIPIGAHEIVFRHPQLGERRQTVVVKVGSTVPVTQQMK